MRAAIIFSASDEASMLVRQVLIENFGFKEEGDVIMKDEIFGVTIGELHLYVSDERLARMPADLLVVASRHESERGINGLLTHATGNWGAQNEYGGLPYTLSYTMAGALEAALKTLAEEAEASAHLRGWHVSLEATHHGPFSPKPLLYVEFGGSEEGLRNIHAAAAVAAACLAACRAGPAKNAAIGLGGNHYAARFTSLALRDEYSFGHIAARYNMPLRREVLEQALRRVYERPKTAVLDWKNIPSSVKAGILEDLRALRVEEIIKH